MLMVECSTILKFFLIFEQGVTRFHFLLASKNFVPPGIDNSEHARLLVERRGGMMVLFRVTGLVLDPENTPEVPHSIVISTSF